MPKSTTWAGCLFAVGLAGCSSSDLHEEQEALGSVSQALAFGIQGFARFDAAGVAVPGSVATTIGTTVDAVRTSVGRYTVKFHSLAAFTPSAAGQGGTVQIVAVGAGNVRCTLASDWSFSPGHDVEAQVACRAPGAGFADSGFFAYFGRGPGSSGKSAYARVAADASVAMSKRYSSEGASITASHPGTGAYWVFINAADRQQVQVTAISTSAHCHAALREFGVTTVRCFNDTGAPVDAAFTVNQASGDSLPLYGVGAFAQVKSSGSLDIRYDYNACGLGETTASRLDVGRYTVSHTLVGATLSSYQVNAYTDAASYCKVDSVSTSGGGTVTTVTAQCYSATGAPQDSGLVESYAVGSAVASGCLPQTLATSTAPSSVTANASTVWFTNYAGIELSPGLVSVPRNGGASTTLKSGAEKRTFNSVFATSDFVYWIEAGFPAGGGGLYRKPLVGGSVTKLRSLEVVQQHALAEVGGMIYFADATHSQIYKISSAGAFTGLWDALGPNSFVYPFNIAADSTRAYFVKDTGAIALSEPLTGGDPTELSTASGPSAGIVTSAIATDGSYVYWATEVVPGSIFRVPVGGGTTTTFASAGGLVTGLAVYGNSLHWTVKSPGKVMRMPLAGGTARTLASGEAAPTSIFVDAIGVLWTTSTTVRSLRR